MENSLYLKTLTGKVFKIITGLFIISLGNVLMIYANLGLNSWGILHQGISLQTPLTFGQASQLLGLFIIVICSTLGSFPGIGTILNMYFVGAFTDLLKDSHLFTTPRTIYMQFVMLIFAILIMDIGMYLYLKEKIGAGPKDGLMLILTKRCNLDMGLIRTIMEVTAVVIGFLLGGKFGIGTIIAALALGPILRYLFKIFGYDPKKVKHEDLLETIKQIKSNKIDMGV
ncbi:MAG: hypothetical protein M0P77_00765 [Firmicutes bacterium]|nr:hypothetical protein [Bacillota bacterium]